MYEKFYYLYRNEEQTFTAMPTGEVDSDKIRQKDPKFWVSRYVHEELKPKSLILNDIFYFCRSEDAQKELRNILQDLLDKNFPLFYWKQEVLTALNSNNLSELDQMGTNSPEVTIKQATKNLKLTKDSVFLLDAYWISQLLSGQKESQEHVLLASVWGGVSEHSKPRLIKQLALIKPKVNQFIYDVYPEQKAHKPPVNMKLTVLRRYQAISAPLKPDISEDMLSDGLRVHFNNNLTDEEQFENLQTMGKFSHKIKFFIWYDGPTNARLNERLKQLLTHLTNLTNLILTHLTECHADLFTLLQPSSLGNLKSLTLYRSTLAASQLSQVLLAAPNLEIINLSSCRDLTTDLSFSLEPRCLSHLRSLQLAYNSLTTYQLKQFIHAAPAVEILNLTNCTDLSADLLFSLEAACLPNLKSLLLSKSSITTIILEQLLNAAFNLVTLDLSFCIQLTAEHLFSRKIGTLSQLKSLKLQYSSLTASQLQQLLLAALNLEMLDLNYCQKLNALFSLEPDYLSKLKSITLSNSFITASQLQQLLLAAPNLEKLDLNYYEQFTAEELFSLPTQSFKKLKSLNLKSSSITASKLEQFLNATPNLEHLDLNGCKNLTSDTLFSLKPVSLNKLKSIDLGSSSLTANQSEQLILEAPHLETLYLSDCKLSTLHSFSLLNSGCLKSLQTLHLGSSSLLANQINALLLAAPKVQILTLSELKTEQLGSIPKKYFSHLKKLELAPSSIIGSQLAQFLKASPHLEKLTINSCTELHRGKFSPLKARSMSNLNSITAHGASLTREQLNNLLLAAPNLQALRLASCSLLGTEFLFLPSRALPQLKSLNLSCHSTPLAYLSSLLLAAPNLENLDLENSIFTPEPFLLPPGCLMKLKTIYLYSAKITEAQIKQLQLAVPNVPLKYLPPASAHNLSVLDSPNSSTLNSSAHKPCDPVFNPKNHLRHTSITEKENEQTAITANNQGMIIAKLSHYLKNKDSEKYAKMIASIQDGICYPLSLWYSQNPTEFSAFFNAIKAWDYKTVSQPSTSLSQYFQTLVRDYLPQDIQQPPPTYLGAEGIERLLAIKKSLILRNPWHAIALIPPVVHSKGYWTVYDPNYADGPKQVLRGALKATITQALGDANLSVNVDSLSAQSLTLPNNFFQEGGLLTLCAAENWEEILPQLEKRTWTAEELENGLFLRTTLGVPAWFLGLQKAPRIQNFTKALLDSYKKQCLKGDEDLFKEKLAQNISNLSLQSNKVSRKPEWTTKNPNAKPDETTQALLDIIMSEANPKKEPSLVDKLSTVIQAQQQDKAFESWCVAYLKSQAVFSNDINDLKDYGKNIYSIKENTLISCKSDEDRRTLQLELYQQAVHCGHPVYYIDSPEELICSANYIDSAGNLQKGPGGPLYDFLNDNKDHTPTLLINYDSFKDSDFSQYNALFDGESSVDGVFFHQLFEGLSPNALEQNKTQLRVIGFRNSANPNCYNESDFTSRMPHKRKAPKDLPKPLPLLQSQPEANYEVINLFHSPYWKSELLGQWVPEGQGFRFKEGLLAATLRKEPKNLLIQNGLETNAEYQAFWQQAQTLGFINYQGRRIELPQALTISHQTGYDWNAFKSQPIQGYRGTGQGEVMNPTRFQSLFKRYKCHNNCLSERKGLIEKAAKSPHKSLTLTITRTMNPSQWAKLLTKSAEAKITLHLYLAEGVDPPPELDLAIQAIKPGLTRLNEDRIYPLSSSVEAKKAIEGLDNPLAINVSEVQTSDLIKRLRLKDSSTSELTLAFEEINGALIKALEKNRTVVLKGQISEALMDELQAVLQDRKHNPNASGRLLIMPTTLVRHPDLKRFETLSNTPPQHVSAQAFTQGRINACEAALKTLPYVFLSGLSGVGKTTFVEKEFCGPNKHTLHLQMEDWLKAKTCETTEHYHILFIDEANLSARDFSEFEDLFNTPPTLLYKGKIYPLSSQHKIVFAGNPLSYGEGRKLASLFQEHGGAVVFEPLAYSVVEDNILAPIFEGMAWTLETKTAVQNHLLDVYKTLCGYSESNILISPRELQMMALLTATYCQNFKADPRKVVEHYAYQLAASLVPEHNQSDFERFKPKHHLEHEILSPVAPKESTFCVTPSRKPLEQTVHQLFLLRQQRRQTAATANEAQLYGGLGGLVLEGSPGVGKSELLVHLLRSWDFEEVHGLREGDVPKGDYFYRIPANFSIKQKKILLKQAFHEGAVVIMDEINSSPMMESFLNHLLMGRDETGLHPKNPGFILLGTQNPVTFSGRRQASEALNRRLQTVNVPEYPLKELIQILETKGAMKTKAQIMSQQWQKAYHRAQSNHSTPPTFRVLMNMAKESGQVKIDKRGMSKIDSRSKPIGENVIPSSPISPKEEDVSQIQPNPKPQASKTIKEENPQLRLKTIQSNFIEQIKCVYKRLKKEAARDIDELNAVYALKTGLMRAQSKLFANLRRDLPQTTTVKKNFKDFSLSCSRYAKEADAVMEHGWLFRAVEVVAKSIGALFVGLGMSLGSIVLQGFAKESHCAWYKHNFFTFHKTQASIDIKEIDKAVGELKSQLTCRSLNLI